MFSELKKKVEEFSANPDLAMRQRAIDEGRMGRQIEIAGAFHRGKEEGREEGIEEGRVEGREEARAEERCKLRATVQRMLAEGMSKEVIAKVHDMSLDELKILLAEK